MTLPRPLNAVFFLIGFAGIAWMNLTLARMLGNVNQRLEPSKRIGLFAAVYKRGRIIQYHRSFLPGSKLPMQLRTATIFTVIGFIGFFITGFANDMFAK